MKRLKVFLCIILAIAVFELECYLLSASDTTLNIIGGLIIFAAIVFGVKIEVEYKCVKSNEKIKNDDNDVAYNNCDNVNDKL